MKQQPKILLQTKNISKTFGRVVALNDINLDVHQGKVNVLVGENGAGKSTLMKILSGVYSNFEGNLLYRGKEVKFKNPKDAMQSGVAIIHQELNLIPYLNISENIFLGRELLDRFGFLNTKLMDEKTSALLKRLDCNLDPKTLVSSLRVGEQQLVEIAKALLEKAKLVIMDEPTSAISEAEVSSLFKIIKSLKEDKVTILYISHKLDELFEIADRFLALRDGHLVGSLEHVHEVNKDELIKLMVGRDVKEHPKTLVKKGKEVLRIENFSLAKTNNRSTNYFIKNIHFSLKQGEVLGLFGLMGAGRTELLESIFGLHPKRVSGSVFIENKKVTIKSVMDAIDYGLALVPEDRKENGLVLQMGIDKNTSMARIDSVVKYGLLNATLEGQLSRNYIAKLQIKTPSEKVLTKNLSGGNQQKVVLAKWLATSPKILFLDEPTRGIDVKAKNEIYNLIQTLARQGLGVVVVSSELPEIMSISDRILVLGQGRITGEFSKENAHEEDILKAAIQ